MLISVDFYDNPELKKLERPALHKDEKGNTWITGQSFLGRFENSIKTYDNLIEVSSENQNSSLSNTIQAQNSNYFFYGSYYNGLLLT